MIYLYTSVVPSVQLRRYFNMNKRITYLPHVKERLQEKFSKITSLINEGKIEAALSHIDILLKHEYKPEQLYMKKLYCLRALERWQKVEQLAESLQDEQRNPEIDLYYILSLFMQEQYEHVIDFFHESIETELTEQIPENIYKEMKHFYDESKHIINEKAKTIEKKLQLAIASANDRDQWLLFHQWDKLNVEPPTLFYYMLQEKRVNPIVKTYILNTMQKWQIQEEVTVSKVGKAKTFKLNELSDVETHPVFRATLQQIDSIEQNNPTLHALVLELLQRYVEYIYPYIYENEDIVFVSEAVIILARHHLEGAQIKTETLAPKTDHFIKQIEYSNEAHFRLMMT